MLTLFGVLEPSYFENAEDSFKGAEAHGRDVTAACRRLTYYGSLTPYGVQRNDIYLRIVRRARGCVLLLGKAVSFDRGRK